MNVGQSGDVEMIHTVYHLPTQHDASSSFVDTNPCSQPAALVEESDNPA